MRVLILGAGFGGLEVSTRLSEELGDGVDVVLIDQTDSFVFGFAKLDVMFGRRTEDAVRNRYADIVKPGVRFVQASITSIDPVARRVETDAGSFEGDAMIVALGADLDVGHTPGFAEGGHEFYTERGAFDLRETIDSFPGGRVVIGVMTTPFKCPPAPSETALLMDEHLTRRGIRDGSEIVLAMPFGRPIPPSPDASDVLVGAFAERGIDWRPQSQIRELDPAAREVVLADERRIPYDLFLGVPHHRAPDVVRDSGLAPERWVPVDPLTLETSFQDVYAVGDVADVGTPRAGVFAEGQAKVVADRLVARARGVSTESTYGGRGVCYLEFGKGEVALVDVTFFGDVKRGELRGPSAEFAAEKVAFGSSRVARWFAGS